MNIKKVKIYFLSGLMEQKMRNFGSSLNNLIQNSDCRIQIFSMVFLFSTLFLFSQNVTITTKTDTNNVLIGDQVHLTISVKSDKKTNIVMPEIPDSAGKIVFIAKSKIDTVLNGKDFVLNQKLTLTSFDSGTFVIPQFTAMYEKSGYTTLYPVSTDSFFLRFRTVRVDTAKPFKDIKGQLEEPISWEEYLPYVYWTLGVIIAIIAGYYLWKRFKPKKQETLEYDPKIPPYIIALESLKQLDNEKLWQKGYVKQYHSRLSDIIRTYIERRFKFLAMEMVTDDILSEMRKHVSDSKQVENLRYSLQLADLAKFAKFQPLPDENSNSMNKMYEFVNTTANIDNAATSVGPATETLENAQVLQPVTNEPKNKTGNIGEVKN